MCQDFLSPKGSTVTGIKCDKKRERVSFEASRCSIKQDVLGVIYLTFQPIFNKALDSDKTHSHHTMKESTVFLGQPIYAISFEHTTSRNPHNHLMNNPPCEVGTIISISHMRRQKWNVSQGQRGWQTYPGLFEALLVLALKVPHHENPSVLEEPQHWVTISTNRSPSLAPAQTSAAKCRYLMILIA